MLPISFLNFFKNPDVFTDYVCSHPLLTVSCHALHCSVNSDGLSPLDVAVLVGNKAMAKILVAFGAQEGNQCE